MNATLSLRLRRTGLLLRELLMGESFNALTVEDSVGLACCADLQRVSRYEADAHEKPAKSRQQQCGVCIECCSLHKTYG
jgi:hypothetical protein